MALAINILNECGLSNKEYFGCQPKTDKAGTLLAIYFIMGFQYLYVSNKTERFSYKSDHEWHVHCA